MKLFIQPLTRVALVLLLALPAISLASSHGNMGINIEDSYVRVVPPGQENTGAFMTIHNPTDKARSVVSAESSAAKIVELHTHIQEDGMMKMRRIEKIDIPAKGHTMLKPGGLHVMLIGLTQPIEEGKPVEITLVFANGERKTVKAAGRKLQMKMKHEGMNHSDMQHKMH